MEVENVDWKALQAEYIAGGTSYRKLSAKYKVPRSNLERRAKNEKWAELRRQAEGKAEAKIVETVATNIANIDDKYFKLVDDLMEKAQGVIDSVKVWQPTNIKEMASALKYLKECKGVKSEADIREQEARIKNLEKQLEESDDSLTEIEVVFKDGEEEWNE